MGALQRVAWLMASVAGVCWLVWCGWRLQVALDAPAQKTSALQAAADKGERDLTAFLQQAHQVLDALGVGTSTAAEPPGMHALQWIQDAALFAPFGMALTRLTPDIRFVYFDNLVNAAHGVEHTPEGFRFGGREPHDAGGPVFGSRRLGTSNFLTPGVEPLVDERALADGTARWTHPARQTSARVWSAAAWSQSSEQLEVTLSQAVSHAPGDVAGVVGTDLGLKRLPELLQALRVTPGSVVYLVDETGRLLASTYEEPMVNVQAGQLQRRSAADSASAAVRASFQTLQARQPAAPQAPTGLAESSLTVHKPALATGNLVVLRQGVQVPSGPLWQLVVAAPARDFSAPVAPAMNWLGTGLFLAMALGGFAAMRLRRAAPARAAHWSVISVQLPADARAAEGADVANTANTAQVATAATAANVPGQAPLSDSQTVAALRAELAAASEKALAAARSRAAFLAVVSHEFRTPLNGATGMGALLAETPLTAEQRSYLNALTASSQQLQTLLDEIIEFSRAESGAVVLQSVPLDVRSVMDQACDDAATVALNKGLDFELKLDGLAQPWKVLGDPARITKVVKILVLNAIKFTDMGGVRVMVRRAQMQDAASTPAIEVQVIDTGPGMAPAQLRHIFKPFTQLDTSLSRQHGGTGLGLAICKRLTSLMGGTLDVESSPGQGSLFRLTLPAPVAVLETSAALPTLQPTKPTKPIQPLQKSTTPALPARERTALADSTGELGASAGFSQPSPRVDITVLVVDDNLINLKVVCAMLRKFGYTVRTASGGRDAIAQVDDALSQGEKIDVVLMDVHMPGVDGIQATQAILTQHGPQAPPIIALTADVSGHYVQRCTDAGMVEYLTKPVQPWALAQALLRWVGTGPAPGASMSSLPPSPSPPPLPSATPSPPPSPHHSLAPTADLEPEMPRGLVDMDRLNDFREFDDSQFTITREVINLLFKEVPIKLAALEQAVANDDVAALTSAAHSLRGVSGHVGAVVVQHLCSVLERSAIAEGRVPADAGACLVALRSAWRRTRPLLEDWR